MRLVLTFFSLMLFSSIAIGQSLSVLPEKPSGGEPVTFSYDKTGTTLEEITDIKAIAYIFGEKGFPNAKAVPLIVKNGKYTGVIPTTDATKSVFILFSDESGELTDNNTDKGYKVKMYSADKSKVVKGAYKSLASAHGSYGSLIGLSRDQEKGVKYSQKELKYYPESKFESAFMRGYANLAERAKDEAALTEVKSVLEELLKKRGATEEERTLTYWLSKTIKDEEGAEAIAKKLRKRYNRGELIRYEDEQAFYKERDLVKKEELFQRYEGRHKKAEGADKILANMSYRMASGLGNKKEWDKFQLYFDRVTDPNRKASLLNNFAWNLSGAGLEREAEDIDRAKNLSEQSLNLIKAELKDLEANRPSYLTEDQWKKRLKGSYYMYADTYALTLYKAGEEEEALEYQEKVCDKASYVSGDMYERLALFMEKVKGPEAAEKLLVEKIRSNNATETMKKQHKRLFLANNSLEDAYGKYLEGLEKEASVKFKEELVAKMIDEEAPDFKLVDLAGKPVSLEDMKGKVVILDFWATWCGPCKASFPGMQKMVDQHKDNDQVVFLFIDTWESVKEKEKVVKEFIEKNKYSFQVLMDTKDEVVAKYKVEGIPTKFVLDGEGKIRFKSVGFVGNDEALMTEMNLMIELAGGAKAEKLTKADD